MKLDSNRAWKHASGNVARNRDALLAVAGVFFLLPQLALALFFPQPEPTAGMNEQQIAALVQSYYASALPVMIPMVICQAMGTLALMTLLNNAARPTVGDALRWALGGLLTYLGAQMVMGIGVGVMGGLVLTVLSLSGVAAVALAGLLLVVIIAIMLLLRVSLSGAVVAIEGERHPIKALQRSWALTAGNTSRLLGFYALVLVAFMVILMMINLAVGIPLNLLTSDGVAKLVTTLVSATLNAVMGLYFAAIIAAVHHQLADDQAETFQ